MASERRLCAGIAGVACALFACTVAASTEPSAADKATARACMADGRTMRAKGNLEGALKSFTVADALMHVPTTGLEVARTLEIMGRLVEARSTLRRVMAIPLAPTDPAPFQEAVTAAYALHAELEQRIPVITFVLPLTLTKISPKVWVDGQPVPASELGAPLRLDPGPHQIAAQLGQYDATSVIDLRERDRQPVVLKVPSMAQAAPGEHAATADSSPWKTVEYVSFATSAVGLVVGGLFGGLALSIKRSADANCNGPCPPATWEAIDRARDYGTVSTVGLVTFGAALGVGLTSLALTPARDANTRGSTVRVRPAVGLGYAELRGSF